jgi:hypothetical protein
MSLFSLFGVQPASLVINRIETGHIFRRRRYKFDNNNIVRVELISRATKTELARAEARF